MDESRKSGSGEEKPGGDLPACDLRAVRDPRPVTLVFTKDKGVFSARWEGSRLVLRRLRAPR